MKGRKIKQAAVQAGRAAISAGGAAAVTAAAAQLRKSIARGRKKDALQRFGVTAAFVGAAVGASLLLRRALA